MISVRAAVLVCLTLPAIAFGNYAPVINTKSGKVMGVTKTTFDGIEVDTFYGIPYADPPTGKNRFGPPKEAEPWSGTVDATVLPRPCSQFVDSNLNFTDWASPRKVTEDCLKLNIWAPKHRTGKNAVMVWIYGGAFNTGSIDLALYDGSTLAAQEEVIVVSVNYRLSGFGFLYLEHPLAPGNVGLMDQALGMQWVKKNIEAFGGDPDRVTIFGESAGGASVGLHLLAPSSSDLFKNAILQSGTGVNFWSTFTPEEALTKSLLLAEKAGCPVKESNREETIRCLQGISDETLCNVMAGLGDRPSVMIFRPVVDGVYLPKNPPDLLAEVRFPPGEKNILVGYTKEDGSFILSINVPYLEITEDSVYSEEQILNVMSSFTNKEEKISGLPLDLVKHVYTDWDNPDDRIAARGLLVHFLTDRYFACPAIDTASKMADKGNNVFLYRFDQVPMKNGTTRLPKWMGSSHAFELSYVFGHMSREQGTEDAKVSKRMMRYWANFAKNGDPNDGYLLTWPKYERKQKLMLTINGKALGVVKNDRQRECAFWEHVYPKTKTTYVNEV